MAAQKVNLGVFPSGQWGQTVNLLLFSFGGSNPPAPTKKIQRSNYAGFFVLWNLEFHFLGWIRTAAEPTAASGGNREQLLGPRPAGCERQRSRRWEPQPGFLIISAARAIHPRPPKSSTHEWAKTRQDGSEKKHVNPQRIDVQFWSEQRDLNPRPLRPERSALPTALCPENTAASFSAAVTGWG